jgi:succinoglycan biosynthesis transport protein ExoP
MANEALRLYGPAGEPAAGDAEGELDLRGLWRALARRKWLLLGTILVITGATYLYASQQTPLFQAKTLIHTQNRDAPVVGEMENVVEELPVDPATIQSEVQLLLSPTFMRRVAEELNLIADPEFNGTLRAEQAAQGEPSLGDRVASLATFLNPMNHLPEGWAAMIGLAEPTPGESGDTEAREMTSVVGALSARTEVLPMGQSYVIELAFSSEDPVKAARIANAMAEEYLVTQVESKYEAAQRATEWLSGKIRELRGKVLEAEAKVVEYRSKNDLVNTGPDTSNSPAMMQFAQLNTQLALSQAERAEAEARLSQVRSILNAEGGPEAAAKVVDSPLMQSLRDQETELMRRMSDLSSELGERHPLMVNLTAEVQSVRDKIGDEVERIMQDLQNNVAVAQARENQLRNSLAGLRQDASGVDMAAVELRDLTREAESNRLLFETFLNRFREVVEQQELQEADARVLSTAEIPSQTAYPNTGLLTLLAFSASTVLGMLLVFVAERWDHGYGFRSTDEVQKAIGARALALVPDLSRREIQGSTAEEYVLEKPNSAFAEALQRIRTGLFLSDDGHPPKTVLVTSSVPLEGKSAIAAALARQSARSGLKVILIDADMRRPRLHEVMGLSNQNGLSEVLTGRANPEAAIKRDEKSGLDFLPAGVGVISPPDLFRTSTMKILLEEMAAYYDLVIIDSPPVTAVSDSFTLSGLVDKVLYVVRWEQTPRNVALAGIRQMVEAGADIAGVVLSRVDVKKHARYGYADSGYYQGYYRKYYIN